MDDSLSVASLIAGSRRFAHLAMDAHGHGDHDLFALHGGVAVERLAKAALAAKSPALLMELRNNGVEMLFHFTGVQASDKVRTIGAMEALSRLRRLGVLAADAQLDLLIELRNGVAHSTQGDQGLGLLPVLARTIETLLASVDHELADYWGRWTEAVQLAVDEARGKVERDVQLRIQQARHSFADRFEGLPDGTMQRVQEDQRRRPPDWSPGSRGIHLSEGPDRSTWTLVHAVECPACEGQANAYIQLQLQADASSSSSGSVLFTATRLHCTLCSLELRGAEELAAAGLDPVSLSEAVASTFEEAVSRLITTQ
jgi:hypothetical protein